jgi:hypothetical protein
MAYSRSPSAFAPRFARLVCASAFGMIIAITGASAAGLLGHGSAGAGASVGAGAGGSMVGSHGSGAFDTDTSAGRGGVRSNTDADSSLGVKSTLPRDSDRDDDHDRKRGPSTQGITGAGHASEKAETHAAPNSAVGIGAAGETGSRLDRQR